MKSLILLVLLGLVSSSILNQPKVQDSSQTIPAEDHEQSLRHDGVTVGDMILTRRQYEWLYSKPDFGRSGVPEKWNNVFTRWPKNRLPYVIDPSISASNKDHIERVVSKFNSEMSDCFSIVPQTTEEYYVNVVKGDGCKSWWGRKGDNWQPGQPLILGEGCYSDRTIIHEFIHAIGFAHEQNRPDRDDYVTINWENIEEGAHSQFDPYGSMLKWLTFGTKYDGKSIMHYPANTFSKNGKPVMTSKNSDLFTTNEMGQSKWMTDTDRLDIREMYGCKICRTSKWSGDRVCDDVNNNSECNWDGGDCCPDQNSNPHWNYTCSECLCIRP